MKTLKFRAWDGQSMVSVGDIQFFTNGMTRVNNGSKGGAWPESEKHILMRRTELPEKNGLEVYIGDIVKFHYFYMGGGEGGVTECEAELTGVVDEDEYGWVVKAIKGQHWKGFTGYEDGEGSSYILGLYSMNEGSIHEESFEKIGNIFEHKHLLNDQKEKA